MALPTPHEDIDPVPDALDRTRVPTHVACVMDGNGRWANARGLPRTEGHGAGEEALLDVVNGALEIGVRWLTALRLLDRELAAPGRRGALSDGVQRVPPDAPARRAQREGRADPLRRAPGLAGAPPGAAADGRVDRADQGQPDHDPDHGLQLRRAGRDRRRGQGAGGRGGLRRTRSTRRRSGATSTSPTCPTPTW